MYVYGMYISVHIEGNPIQVRSKMDSNYLIFFREIMLQANTIKQSPKELK